MRGLAKVNEQGLLAAACQNMKKIALHLGKLSHDGPKSHINRTICSFSDLIWKQMVYMSKILEDCFFPSLDLPESLNGLRT
jgi:hypothetical protein